MLAIGIPILVIVLNQTPYRHGCRVDLQVARRTRRHTLASPSWVGGFESGDLSQWAHPGINSSVGDEVLQGDFAAVTSPVRDGAYAGRFTVHAGDCLFKRPSQERAEVYLDPQTTRGLEGMDEWYAWSSFFPNTDSALGNYTTNTSLG